MDNPALRTWAEIDLDRIRENIRILRGLTRPNARIMGIVKADAYGHGYLEVANTLLGSGVSCLGVASVQEARQLRRSGVLAPILVLSFSSRADLEDLVSLSITPTVFSYAFAKELSDCAASRGCRAKIHLKIDTGMSRLGLPFHEDEAVRRSTVSEILKIAALPGIEVEGIYSHFAASDEDDRSFTELQFQRFMSCCRALEEAGLLIPIKHICNSAGILEYPEMHLDMVRAGVAMYGLYPSESVRRVGLMPAMSLKASVTQVKDVPAGASVSYGRTYTASSPRRLAVVPIGYADGYQRSLSGKVEMIADGKRVPQVGRICMDQCMIDVSEIKNIKAGDEIIIIGEKAGNNITVEEIADIIGTINYEVVCDIGKRVPRVYVSHGKILSVLDYLAQSDA